LEERNVKYFKTLGLTCGALATLASSAAAEDVVMAYSGSLQDPAMVCSIQTVSKEIAALLGGEVEMHVGGTGFASPRNLYTQLERGVTDISIMPLAYTPGRFPLSEIIGLPFVASDNTAAAIAATTLIPDYLADEYAGTHPLAVMTIPHYQIHLRDDVPDLTTGLEGLRIRVTGETLSDTVRALGADIVAVPIFQVYENMQKGVFDGFALPNVPLAAFKLAEVSDYHVQVDIGMPVLYFGLSNDFWDGLSPEMQATITERYAGPEAAERYTECFNKQDAGALNMAVKTGGTSRDATEAELAGIAALAAPIVEAYLAKTDDAGLDASGFYAAFSDAVSALEASN
jgi:TRAP-type C4-dicarboxylate transport system substrate-binding protein